MNYDEFAFFNQQLAAMLRDGIPLEGALKRLSSEMRQSPLRGELERLAADLSRGAPLREAARARDFPDLYRQLLEVGQSANDLPAALTLLADYYERRHLTWTRLKGLLVYPVIVLACAFGLSVFLSSILYVFIKNEVFTNLFGNSFNPPSALLGLWLPPCLIGAAFLATVAGLTVPTLRRRLRWRLPAFKEASLAQLGSAMSMMLKSGAPLNEALAVVEKLEAGTPAQPEIAAWRQNLAAGRARFAEMAAGSRIIPPLFVWMVGNAGEDLGAGFQTAGCLYQSRAAEKSERLLWAALPCAVMVLGLMIVAQIGPGLMQLFRLIQNLSS